MKIKIPFFFLYEGWNWTFSKCNKMSPRVLSFHYYSLNQQFLCLFVSKSQWPSSWLHLPGAQRRWPHFLPSWWRGLVLLCFSAHMHRYVSETPCDLLPHAWGACWLRNHCLSSRTDVQPCLSSQARATGNHVSPSCWIVVLELGGPGARRKIYFTSLSPPPAPQPPPQPAAPLPCPHT